MYWYDYCVLMFFFIVAGLAMYNFWPCKKKTPSPLETRKERAIKMFSEILNEEFTTVDEKKEIVAGVLVRTLPRLHLKCRPYTHIKRKEK